MDRIKRIELESKEKWSEWVRKIPAVKFKDGWEVKVIPPYAGAMVRFIVCLDDAQVSVYLDCYDALGCVGEPYWEVYPVDDDVFMVCMCDTEELVQKIDEALAQQLQSN